MNADELLIVVITID